MGLAPGYCYGAATPDDVVFITAQDKYTALKAKGKAEGAPGVRSEDSQLAHS